MSEQLTLPAETRERAGKGASRALRRDGRVPCVIYGDKKEPLEASASGAIPLYCRRSVRSPLRASSRWSD